MDPNIDRQEDDEADVHRLFSYATDGREIQRLVALADSLRLELFQQAAMILETIHGHNGRAAADGEESTVSEQEYLLGEMPLALFGTSELAAEDDDDNESMASEHVMEAGFELGSEIDEEETTELEDENDLPEEIPIPHPDLCVACNGDFDDETAVLPACGHRWHKDCINQNFRIALQSRINWPPKRCNRRYGIATPPVRDFLDDDVRRLLSKREEEFSTAKPVYCPNCHTFLPTRSVRGTWTTCCNTTICVTCGSLQSDHRFSRFFGTLACPDKLSAEDRALATEAGWKPCPTCRNLIERSDGCNKMLCSYCKTKFCYECGASRDNGTPCECGTWGFEQQVAGFEGQEAQVRASLVELIHAHRLVNELGPRPVSLVLSHPQEPGIRSFPVPSGARDQVVQETSRSVQQILGNDERWLVRVDLQIEQES